MTRSKLIVVLFLIISLLAVYLLLKNDGGKRSIIIEATPSDAVILLNGKKINQGKHSINDQKVIVKFKREGFEEKTIEKTLDENNTTYIGGVLIPQDQKYKDWYKENIEEQNKSSSISSRNADQISFMQQKKNPIIYDLPYEGVKPSFRIDYGKSRKEIDPEKIALFITGENYYAIEEALMYIRSKGYDPTNFEVYIDDKTNIFNPTEPHSE